MKHKFMPYGSQIRAAVEDVPMDVDVEMEVAPGKGKPGIEESSPKVEGKRSKGKKRKGEADASSPKKTKKANTAS